MNPQNSVEKEHSVSGNIKGHLSALLDKIGNKDNNITNADSNYKDSASNHNNFETKSLMNFNRINSLMNDIPNDTTSVHSNQSLNNFDFKTRTKQLIIGNNNNSNNKENIYNVINLGKHGDTGPQDN